MRKLMLCLLMLLCVCGMACAEEVISFVPQMEAWDSSMPMEAVLSVDVRTHMPFDDVRCEQLNALLKHISLRINTASDDAAAYSRIGVRVDGAETMAITQRQQEDETSIKLSAQPDLIYSAKGDGLNALLGDTAISIYGLDGNEQAWLDDGYALACVIGTSLEDYKKEATIKTSIANMGTARKKVTYTIPKAEADQMAEALAEHCTEGELGNLLTNLVFSGQQKLILWLNSEGKPLRVEYAGNCGVDEDHLRKVSLVWRMRRDESAVRDVITLKTPAVRGTDYNTLSYTRALVKGKKSKINYDSEFEYTWKSEKKKTTLSGVVDLTNTTSGKNAKITGTVTIKQLLPGEETSTSFKLKPDLTIGQESVKGKVTVQELFGKNIIEDADILLEMNTGTYLDETFDGEIVDIAAMSEEQKADFAAAMSSALIPHLVLLPEEDVQYLSADLPADVWQTIVDAARTSLEEAEQ